MSKAARIWFGITAGLIPIALIINAYLNITADPVVYEFGNPHSSAEYGSWWARVLNTYTYFTILSNIIVMVTSALLAKNPLRFSPGFAVWRVAGLVAITITGLVYNLVLAQLIGEQTALQFTADTIVHRIVPVMAVVGWLLFGPRLPFRWSTIGGGVLIGLAWLTMTFIRGAFPVANQENDYYYPYPFLDVAVEGWGTVLMNTGGILVLYLLLAVIILSLDRVLPGPRPPTSMSNQANSPAPTGAA
jgi:hypothetical protein